MASFLEEIRPDGAGYVAGELTSQAARPPLVKVRSLRQVGRPPLRPAEETTALLLVHSLRTEHPAELRELVRRLRVGEPESAAFPAAFPGVSDADLDAAVAGLHAKPRSHPMTFALTPYAGELRVETLSPAEVRALFDLLWQRTGDLR